MNSTESKSAVGLVAFPISCENKLTIFATSSCLLFLSYLRLANSDMALTIVDKAFIVES